jgi:hypothetical protein
MTDTTEMVEAEIFAAEIIAEEIFVEVISPADAAIGAPRNCLTDDFSFPFE